jgi:hypothetical protein
MMMMMRMTVEGGMRKRDRLISRGGRGLNISRMNKSGLILLMGRL